MKYTYEEFLAIELKQQAGQLPGDFLEFMGKARSECDKFENGNDATQEKPETSSVREDISIDKKYNDYPAQVAQNFIKSYTSSSGGKTELCSCLFDRVREKYTYKDYLSTELKIQEGKTPSDFFDFMGQARAKCEGEN